MSGVTSASSVGSKYAPAPSTFLPPVSTVAPCSTALSTWSASVSAADCEDSGPSAVLASIGSPGDICANEAVSFSTNSS